LIVGVVIVVVLAVLPLYVGAFWLQVACSPSPPPSAPSPEPAHGSTGQLSLAHAFFLAVGAYGYSYFSGTSTNIGGGIIVHGAGLPPFLALVLAVLLAVRRGCCSARSRAGCGASTSVSPRLRSCSSASTCC